MPRLQTRRDPEVLPFGLETEYAFNLYGRDGSPLDRDEGLHHLLALARQRLVCMRDLSAPGVYLANGARLYIDAGSHPEYSTPECATPWDLVRQVLAGERILDELCREVAGKTPGARAAIFRCNVDYLSQQVWGCHESYLHRSDRAIADELIPHLVSRLIYTGAGGFDNRSGSFRFLVSPRVAHLERRVSGHSTEQRGIFHTKDEPLCAGGYHRLHVICSESLCSQVALFVKVGATALVVRLTEAGISPGKAVALRGPLAAMQSFSADPTCSEAVPTRCGKRLTAIEIQRHYLDLAEMHQHRSFMPPWAPAVCSEWRRLLERLEGGAEAVADTLDWSIKWTLFRNRARRSGEAWADVAGNPKRIHELYEIDTRFGEVGDAGVFNRMDAAGVLNHRVTDPADVATAVDRPPEQGRARARGDLVRELHRDLSRYRCEWSRIVDFSGRYYDLQDPFGRNGRWVSESGLRLRRSLSPEAIRSRIRGRSPEVDSADIPF